jgi:hypothetical protein
MVMEKSSAKELLATMAMELSALAVVEQPTLDLPRSQLLSDKTRLRFQRQL